jgi:hypothetical protein
MGLGIAPPAAMPAPAITATAPVAVLAVIAEMTVPDVLCVNALPPTLATIIPAIVVPGAGC